MNPSPLPTDFPDFSPGVELPVDALLGPILTDEEAETLLAAWDAENPHLSDPDPSGVYLLTEEAQVLLRALEPILQSQAWQQRLATGDPYALEVARACELWQGEQDARRELRRLRREYKAALARVDSPAASKAWNDIQELKFARAAARKGV